MKIDKKSGAMGSLKKRIIGKLIIAAVLIVQLAYWLGGTLQANPGNLQNALPPPVKYASVMKRYEPPVIYLNKITVYFDYKEAMEVARKVKRPLMVDFTGINCVNCRRMEEKVWSNPRVLGRLKDSFVIASLFVDVHESVKLPRAEQYYSKHLRKKVETMGNHNTDFQITKFGTAFQPSYFFLDSMGNRLISKGYGYEVDVEKFINILDSAVARYRLSQAKK